MKTICLVGLGRAGGAFAIALDRAGYDLQKVVTREPSVSGNVLKKFNLSSDPAIEPFESISSITSEIVIIAVPDPHIASVSNKIADKLTESHAVYHLSGSLASSELFDDIPAGVSRGSIHPLVSISDPLRGAASFPGSYFCIEGDKKANETAHKIVSDINGKAFTIKTEYKPLYHAAAVMSAGHVVALFETACSMLERCGVRPDETAKILWPLLASTISNLEKQPAETALTGSFARGDIDAVKRHKTALLKSDLIDALEIYTILGRRSVEIAARAGLDAEAGKRLREAINLAKGNSEC